MSTDSSRDLEALCRATPTAWSIILSQSLMLYNNAARSNEISSSIISAERHANSSKTPLLTLIEDIMGCKASETFYRHQLKHFRLIAKTRDGFAVIRTASTISGSPIMLLKQQNLDFIQTKLSSKPEDIMARIHACIADDYDKFMAGNMTLQELKEYEALTLDEPASIPPIRLKKAVSDKKWRRLFQFHPYGRRNAGSAFDLSTLQNALPATGVNTIPLGGQTISSQIVSAGTNNVGPVRRQRKSHHESLPIRSRHR